MLADHDLFEQAAAGSLTAQRGLVDCAIAAGANGIVRQAEALIAAETWARLAAANGGADEQRTLVGVLLTRARFEVERGSAEGARWYEGEARRILKILILIEDESARQVMDELGEQVCPEPSAPAPHTLAALSAAAGGDVAALGSLCSEAMDLFYSGRADLFETLTVAEIYARLGATAGDTAMMTRLAGILLKRAELEYCAGSRELADISVTEAAVLLSIMTDCGDGSMAPWLQMLVSEAPRPAITAAAWHRPTILKFIEPEGNC